MAWTFTELDSGILAADAADRPLFIAGNVFSGTLNWEQHTLTASPPGVGGEEDAAFPTARAIDGRGDAYTQKSSGGAGERHSLFMTAPVTTATEFDSLFFVMDPGTTNSGSQVGVEVYAYDVNVGDPSPVRIYDSIPGASRFNSGSGIARRVSIDLKDSGGSTSYSLSGTGSLAFTIYVTTSGQYWTTFPRIYEVILGKRYQLGKKSIRPWDPDPIGNNMARRVSDSGVISDYVRAAGVWESRQDWQIPIGTDAYGIDNEQAVRDMWAATSYGSNSFVYIEDPTTAPELARLCKFTNSTLSMPYQGPRERRVQLGMIETPPYAGWTP